MIEEALLFTQQSLNQFLMNRFGNRDKNVVLNVVVDDDNSTPMINQNKMVISLINIENESSRPYYNKPQYTPNGSYTHVNPTERFNLDILITSNFQDYSETLKFLNGTLTFFQVNSTMSNQSHSFFPDALEKLHFELVKMNFDQMHSLWSAMGAKYRPSMVYKMRLISIQGEEVTTYNELVREVIENVVPNG